jgi:hypothetical protein
MSHSCMKHVKYWHQYTEILPGFPKKIYIFYRIKINLFLLQLKHKIFKQKKLKKNQLINTKCSKNKVSVVMKTTPSL